MICCLRALEIRAKLRAGREVTNVVTQQLIKDQFAAITVHVNQTLSCEVRTVRSIGTVVRLERTHYMSHDFLAALVSISLVATASPAVAMQIGPVGPPTISQLNMKVISVSFYDPGAAAIVLDGPGIVAWNFRSGDSKNQNLGLTLDGVKVAPNAIKVGMTCSAWGQAQGFLVLVDTMQCTSE